MNKYNKQREMSLRFFTWSQKPNKNEEEMLIESTILEWYDAKHRTSSPQEIEFINSLKISRCPYCRQEEIIKYGKKKDGTQRYLCKKCCSRFTALTNTIFDSRKIPITEWIEFLLHLFEYHTVKSSSYDNRNSQNTGIFWLKKIFLVLKGVQDNIVIGDKMYIDELYFPVAKNDVVTKDGKKLRGISRNKLGVACIYSKKGTLLVKTGTSKPSDKSTWNAYGNHIKKYSTIIHDGERSHGILIRKLNLKSIVYDTTTTKGLSDKDNPLYPINHYHYLMKRFMRAHGGYNRENLQDWLNLFWFISNEPKDKYEKVLKFIQLAISAPIKLKYRDVFSKKILNT